MSASVWQLELASLDEAAAWGPWLSPEEEARAAAMTNPVLRARFVVSRGLRRKVLGSLIRLPSPVGTAGPAVRMIEQEGQRPAGPAGPTGGKACFFADLEFVENEGTKPCLRDECGWDFNVSHAGDYVVLVVGRGEVGVDLEKIRPVRDMAAVVRRYFHPDEAAAWRALPSSEQEAAFFLLWSAREAAMKGAGTGLAGGLGRTRVDPVILRSDRAVGSVGGKEMILQREKAPEGYVLVTARTVS